MNILGFIPARKGSQGIRGKNLKKLNGKPLIYYTLKTLSKLKTNSNILSFNLSSIFSSELKMDEKDFFSVSSIHIFK